MLAKPFKKRGVKIETTSYDYDRMGRLVSESEVNGNISNNISYEYDDYSNRSQMTVSGEEDYVTTYNYSSNGHYTGLLQKESKKTGDVVPGYRIHLRCKRKSAD